ncbi:regulatory protein YcgZ [Pantoea vagans]|uniref:regulatory protein YcgZ n=1 Tax=Pantoea vagans TaxID=470934 RepID=UPI0010938024|nr:regulatory protein YcgZ [Pantoea vagans]QCA06641.1 two-component-system connector protein YcgZ [Pantoea vagans]
MHQTSLTPDTAGDLARNFTSVQTPSQQETLGSIVVEILRSGSVLSRAAISTALASRLEAAGSTEEEQRCRTLATLFASRQEAR